MARADPRYEGQSEHDFHAWAFYHGYGEYCRDGEFYEDVQMDYSGIVFLDEPTPEDGAAAVPGASASVPYHRPADEAELTAASQRQWTQKRAMFNAMPAGMPAEEQVRRVSLALNYSTATVDALTTWNAYSGQTVAALLSEVAGAVGHEELGDQLASRILSGRAGPRRTLSPTSSTRGPRGTR